MGDQRGMSNSVQLVLIFPLFIFVFFGALQWALHSWASAIALAAAQDGARVSASYDSGPEAGKAEAQKAITSDVLTGVNITATRSATTATVTVSGRAISIVPGMTFPITKSASVPVERFTR